MKIGEIEKNVALPDKGHAPRGSKYAFLKAMEVGDSVQIEADDKSPDLYKIRATIMSVVAKLRAANPGIKFTCRQNGTGLRIWRLE